MLKKVAYLLPLVVPSGMVIVGLASLILLLLGILYTWLVALVIVVVFVGVFIVLHGRIHDAAKRFSWFDVLALALVAGWMGANAFFTAQHLFIDRDPGFYANGAVWISHNPDLDFDFENQFGGTTRVKAPGFDTLNGEQYLQGSHYLPALMGTIGRFVGMTTMLHAVVFFGGAALLAVYAFLRNIATPKWAFMGAGVLSVVLPFYYFSRDSYSEPISLAAIFAGLALLYHAHIDRTKMSLKLWLLSGLVLMGAAAIRIDGLVIVAPLFIALALLSGHYGIKRIAMIVVPVLLGILLLWIDVTQFSQVYYRGHRGPLLSSLLLIGMSLVGGGIYVLALRGSKLTQNLLPKIRAVFSWQVIAGLVALGSVLMISRPLWYEHRQGTNNPVVVSVQLDEHLDPDGFRKYAELTVDWLFTYLGPVIMLLSILGVTIVIWQVAQKRRNELLPWLLIFFVTATLYLNRPSITPDHIWASRRFLPVIIPSIVIAAMLALDYLEKHYAKHAGKRFQIASFVIAGLMLVVFPLKIAKPYATLSAHQHLASIDAVCKQLDTVKNPAVLWVGLASNFFMLPTQTVCGHDSTEFMLGKNDGRAPQAALAKAVAESPSGKDFTPVLGVLGTQLGLIDNWEMIGARPVANIQYQDIQRALTQVPKRRASFNDSVALLKINPDGTLTPLVAPAEQ